jgi:penicillin-insensitive murein DD-endopeptidase
MKIFFTLLFYSFLSSSFAQSEPVGSYNQGTLLNAVAFPESGEGFVQLYRDTNRYYATQELTDLLLKTAAEMKAKFPDRDRLQIEELSGPLGGDLDRHSSHENGLDADLQYFKLDGVEHDPAAGGTLYAPPMVVKKRVAPNFDLERNWELMKTMHKHGDVQRIFVDQKIKAALCKYARQKKEFTANIEVLRSLRHVANHADHLHVRIRCPRMALKCIPQTETPSGSGCP